MPPQHHVDASVDVLIPTKDRPAALAVTLACLIGQTHRPARVVVSDQGAVDCRDSQEVRAVLRTLELDRVEVVVVRNLPRRGMAHQRQVLLDRARSPYALFVDDDVILEPDLLARLLAALREHGCGFMGSFVNAPSAATSTRPIDQLPDDLTLQPWPGRVAPEQVLPDTPAWERRRLHFAAHLYRLGKRLGITTQDPVVYRIAWVGGCYLMDVAKMRACGGFDFWPDLPAEHSGEDVVAQLRMMASYGGAALAPSGAWHQEVRTTRPGGEPDAPSVLDLATIVCASPRPLEEATCAS